MRCVPTGRSHVCNAADTGAFTSQALRSGRFLAVPKLREMALVFADENPKRATKILEEAGTSEDLQSFIENNLADDE